MVEKENAKPTLARDCRNSVTKRDALPRRHRDLALMALTSVNVASPSSPGSRSHAPHPPRLAISTGPMARAGCQRQRRRSLQSPSRPSRTSTRVKLLRCPCLGRWRDATSSFNSSCSTVVAQLPSRCNRWETCLAQTSSSVLFGTVPLPPLRLSPVVLTSRRSRMGQVQLTCPTPFCILAS